MPVALKINVTERGMPTRSWRKQYREAMKRAYWRATNSFVGRFTEERFTASHGRKANYAPRSPKYMARKAREKGHRDPLVWSGATRMLAGMVNVTSTSKQGKVTYPGLRGLNRKARGQRADMRDEFLRILPLEEMALTEQLENAIDHEIMARQIVMNREIKSR